MCCCSAYCVRDGIGLERAVGGARERGVGLGTSWVQAWGDKLSVRSTVALGVVLRGCGGESEFTHGGVHVLGGLGATARDRHVTYKNDRLLSVKQVKRSRQSRTDPPKAPNRQRVWCTFSNAPTWTTGHAKSPPQVYTPSSVVGFRVRSMLLFFRNKITR